MKEVHRSMTKKFKVGITLVVLFAIIATTVIPKNFASAEVEDSGSSNVIIGFDSYKESVVTERCSNAELLAKLPSKIGITLEDGSHQDIVPTWLCSKDFENTTYDMYTYDMQIPNGYKLSKDLSDWDVPYINIFVSQGQQKPSNTNSSGSAINQANNSNTGINNTFSSQEQPNDIQEEQVASVQQSVQQKAQDSIQVTLTIDDFEGTLETLTGTYGGSEDGSGDFEIGKPVNMNPAWFLTVGEDGITEPIIQRLYLEKVNSGYDLKYYAINGTQETEFDWFRTAVTNNTTVVGHWEEVGYKLTVVTNNDNYDQETIDIPKGSSYIDVKGSAPQAPTKKGYTFVKWVDSFTGDQYDFGSKVSRNSTVTAQYELTDATQVVGSENQTPPTSISGTCYINGHRDGANNATYFNISGFDGYLSGASGTSQCVDPGNAPAPNGQVNYTASLVSYDKNTGRVEYDVLILPPNHKVGPEGVDDGWGNRVGVQRSRMRAVVYKNFGGYVEVQKVSSCPEISNGNGMYSMSGGIFGVYDAVTNTKVDTLTTDSTGKTNRSRLLPQGQYIIKEEAPPRGFALNTENTTISVSSGQVCFATVEDEPINDPFTIWLYKSDGENHSSSGKGAASLEGAVFKMSYYSSILTKEQIKTGTYNPERVWFFKTKNYTVGSLSKVMIRFNDADCFISERSDNLYYREGIPTIPLGTITIEEEQPPEGYLKEGVSYFFNNNMESSDNLVVKNITSNGIISPIQVFQPSEAKDLVKRGDLKFVKVDEDSKRLENIPFGIKSKTTGEYHILYTDENGEINTSSEYISHLYNTNRGDYGESGNGVWFYGYTADNYGDKPNDKRGALPYDTYIVQEMPCDANEGLSLVKFEVTISRDSYTVDMGTIIDRFQNLKTTAKDAVTLSQTMYASSESAIVDTVEYTALNTDTEYRLVATLMDKDTGKPIKNDGEVVSVTKKFTPKKSSGSVNVNIPFSSVDLAGKDIVVFERLYEGGTLVGSHEDITDVGQTVKVKNIRIGTQARDAVSLSQQAIANSHVTIIDEVSYEGLQEGGKYKLEAKLMDKRTKSPIHVDGKEVTASKTFVAEGDKGTVNVNITFNGKTLAGKNLVVYERLYDENDNLMGTHEDINDSGQTIKMTEITIGTQAKDAETLTQQAVADADVRIVDTVSYEGLESGEHYTLRGVLMDKQTGEPFKIDGENVVAEKEFTAKGYTGDVNVQFSFDGVTAKNKDLVVFERLFDDDDNLLSKHEDIEDVGQTIKMLPIEIGTQARDGETYTQEAIADEDVTINDTVDYIRLTPNEEYKLEAVLMDKATKKVFKDYYGKEVRASITFTPKKSDDEVVVPIVFDGTNLGNKDVVVFETLKDSKDRVLAEHKDINDGGQTIKLIPIEIGTQAIDKKTESHEMDAKEKAEIIDTVEYKNLTPGREYNMHGVLMDKETNKPITTEDGKLITSDKKFKPENKNGHIEMKFKFDASLLEGKTIVVFETLQREKRDIAVHADIEDAEQSVDVIAIHTNAVFDSEVHEDNDVDSLIGADNTGDRTWLDYLKDFFDTLLGKDDKEEDKDSNDKVESEDKEDEDASGDVESETISPKADTKEETEDTVTNEDISGDVDSDNEGEESDDEEEEVEIINIDEGQALKGTRLIDTVTYINLDVGVEYELSGVVYDKETHQPLIVGGKQVTASVKFTPEEEDGTVDVVFEFDATGLENKNLVVVEELIRDDKVIAEHHDMEDEGQTVHFVDIKTTALGSETKGHEVQAHKVTTIIDRVELTNLTVGNEYIVKGVLMDKENKTAIKNPKGDYVNAVKKFTAEEENCTVDLEFTFDSSLLAGTTTVAFESLYRDTTLIGVHADYEDEGQTVRIIDIGTKATDAKSGGKVMSVGKNVILRDTVSYKNLDPEATYTMKGCVMDKATGMELIIDGNKVTAEATFKPEKPDGEVVVDFKLSTNKAYSKTLVIFEELYDGKPVKIAEHKDINDEDQTVTVPNPPAKKKLAQTGETAMSVALGLVCVIVALGFTLHLRRRRNK